jgi:hypothetical protein
MASPLSNVVSGLISETELRIRNTVRVDVVYVRMPGPPFLYSFQDSSPIRLVRRFDAHPFQHSSPPLWTSLYATSKHHVSLQFSALPAITQHYPDMQCWAMMQLRRMAMCASRQESRRTARQSLSSSILATAESMRSQTRLFGRLS